MKIGILGGTFDPLHDGHTTLADSALKSGLIDEIRVVPAGIPPHKRNEFISMAGYRYEMAWRAFSGQEHIFVSDLEIVRPGPSYTLDTARQFKKKQPDDEWFLIFGSDILKDIERWHQPEALLSEFPLLLADRGGIADSESRKLASELTKRFGARIHFFDMPSIDLSSTMIRRLAASGEPIDAYVPEAVARVIEKNGLYRWHDEMESLDPMLWEELRLLEQRLWRLLKRKRLLHSLNVLMYGLHLALRHQVEARQTALAALLHDCAKCLPEKHQLVLARKANDPALLDLSLAHGPAGAVLAKERFGVDDQAVLRAIHFHTTGCAGMSKLDQIIFVADKVEPARTYAHLEDIRRLVETDLDEATLRCLEEMSLYLTQNKIKVHPYSLQAIDELNQRIKSRQNKPDLI